MSNFEYIVSSEEWVLVYDSSVTGDFSGYAQVVNGAELSVYIGASIPAGSIFGAIVGGSPRHLAINSVYGDKLYARRRGNTAMLSLLTMPWSIVGGAAPVGAAPTVPPVGISAIDLAGLKRAILSDALGQLFTTEQDSEVFTASASSASVLFTVDMTNWRSVLLQVTSAGSSCTISYECSNDQIGWTLVLGSLANYGSDSTLGAVVANSSTAAKQLQFPKRAKYFRARVSVYGSGTVSVAYALSLEDVPSPTAAAIWGQVAEGSAAGGNPVTIGIECRLSRKSAILNGQVVRPIGTGDGRLVVRPHSIPENEWRYAAASGGIVNTTTPVTIVPAQGAGLSIYLTSMQIRAQALTNATEIVLRDGTATDHWRSEIGTAGMSLTNITFEDPIKMPANSALTFSTLTASGAGAVYISAQGYIAP